MEDHQRVVAALNDAIELGQQALAVSRARGSEAGGVLDQAVAELVDTISLTPPLQDHKNVVGMQVCLFCQASSLASD